MSRIITSLIAWATYLVRLFKQWTAAGRRTVRIIGWIRRRQQKQRARRPVWKMFAALATTLGVLMTIWATIGVIGSFASALQIFDAMANFPKSFRNFVYGSKKAPSADTSPLIQLPSNTVSQPAVAPAITANQVAATSEADCNLAADPDDIDPPPGITGVKTIADPIAIMNACGLLAKIRADPRLHHQYARAALAYAWAYNLTDAAAAEAALHTAAQQFAFAAENGYPPALARRGADFLKANNIGDAVRDFRLAIHGSAFAKFKLGELTCLGAEPILKKDVEEGYRLIALAAKQRDPDASNPSYPIHVICQP